MAIKKWLISKNNRGNIAIIVAISLTVLIGMLALVVDGGYLYATKDKYQNGVEAAAMAGVWHMCDGDYESVVRQIAQENGLPSTVEEGLTVHVGYYDAGGQYDDFSEYGSEYEDFVADSDPATSYNDDLSDPGSDEYEYNNAIMVSLNADVSTFLAGIFGKEEAAVSAKAVAYAQRYLMISLGEGDSPGITTDPAYYHWPAGYFPKFYNGILYSNNDIVFDTSYDCDGPEFINSWAYAHGTIYENDSTNQIPTDAFGESGAKEIEVAPIDWDEFRAQAEANGKVIDMDFYNSLPNPYYNWNGEVVGHYGTDEFGNCYFLTYTTIYFVPKGGDHNRRTYFFDINGDDVNGGMIRIRPSSSWCTDWTKQSVTGMTMAAPDLGVEFFYSMRTWGGDEADEIVEFYMGRDINMGPYLSDCTTDFAGVFFRTEGNFGYRQSDGDVKLYPVRKWRVIAGGQVILTPHHFPWPDDYGFDANFGPPCPPIKALLGKLEPAGG